eukprot:CAMPEP_0194094996 /NCGR_PEP_ID=MMETSP0149-20130528/56362_1 /TAXON_ID=122233 /ORGANISM="Chaetoceros debilis, Strain MM31A-1" /LENGTH=776 /DNA_ID=CAMNT_0038780913 /DNA_START=97 /DNA_END=2424 /DNA_ORIENTATION=-
MISASQRIARGLSRTTIPTARRGLGCTRTFSPLSSHGGSSNSTNCSVSSLDETSRINLSSPIIVDSRNYMTASHVSQFTNSGSGSVRAFSAEANDDIDNDVEMTRLVPHIRNVAIVAHVDHGKTTIVDELLRCASESVDDGENKGRGNDDLVMDCGDLERERGITITSKVTRLDYCQKIDGQENNDFVVNVVDTPGHADFAGEVDRILTMIDGVCLVVDAAEGAMAQTKYVLSRALKMGLKPIVVLNKCDKDEAWGRIEDGEVEMELMETFDSLGANDDQMEYVTVYASGKAGWATTDMDEARELASGKKERKVGDDSISMRVLLDTILKGITAPEVSPLVGIVNPDEEPFAMAATTVGKDNFLGRIATGRIYSGTIRKGDTVALIPRETADNEVENMNLESSAVTGLFVNRGVNRTDLDPPVASAGDIVTLAGVPENIAVGDSLTLASNPVDHALETPPINPPTLSMEIGANTSPLAGKEGTKVSSSNVRDRLYSETDNNVTLSVSRSASDAERSTIHARGELQLGILIEQMRREGYELTVSPPRIITTTCKETGVELEPFEEVIVDVETEYSGSVMDKLTGDRKGLLLEMSDSADGKTRLVFEIPSRGLLGFQSEIATATRGTAVVNHLFLENRAHAGHIGGVEKGKMISNAAGKANLFSLANLAQRGELFVSDGDIVYSGMVIGENSRAGDMEVNPVKAKETSNMRTQGKEEKMYVPPPKKMSIEELIGYMSDDEVIEVTPESFRLRKTELDSGARERASRSKKRKMMANNKK